MFIETAKIEKAKIETINNKSTNLQIISMLNTNLKES